MAGAGCSVPVLWAKQGIGGGRYDEYGHVNAAVITWTLTGRTGAPSPD